MTQSSSPFGDTWEPLFNHEVWASAPDGTTGPSVFVVHGQDGTAKESVAPSANESVVRFLEKLKLKAVVLDEQPNRGRTAIEKFLDHSNVGYAVVLLTADDEGRLRLNAMIELGYFFGTLGRDHVCVLKSSSVEAPSLLDGMLYVDLDSNGAWQLRLAREMKHAGLDIDLNLAI